MDIYDYIIVGAGTCGLVVANRLSEDPTVTVAVIEPGGDERHNPNVYSRDNFMKAFDTPIDWNYTTVKQHGAANRELPLHQGKAWGGTSTINGMTYIRGDKAQLDAWESLGNTGWNWDALLPYYKKAENYTIPTAEQVAAGVTYQPQHHGYAGPVHVGHPSTLVPGSFAPAIIDTWAGLGMPHNPDVNSGDVRGVSLGPETMDWETNQRCDAAKAYYHPVEGRRNLRVLQGTARRIVWDESQSDGGDDRLIACGVEVVTEDSMTSVIKARKEVILSAGAVRTPLVLEASGVGNPRILTSLGITPTINLPGVGENLLEQTSHLLVYTGTLDSCPSAFYTFLTASDLFGPETPAISSSILASIPEWARATASAAPSGSLTVPAVEKLLRLQHDLMFEQNVTVAEILTIAGPGGALLSNYWTLLPFSRGSVHLGSADEVEKPLINPRFFMAEFDVTAMMATGRFAQKFWASEPMKGFVTGQVVPSPEVLPVGVSDEQWEKLLRENVLPNSHALGTASMMSRELGGVVDPELRVYGTANVRVVDASVLPMQISGHLCATLYAVAERASDIIKQTVLQ